MNIGFDAKRAYNNNTGLGNYSRTLIKSLAELYADNEYYLFNPKKSKDYNLNGSNIKEINPAFPYSLITSAWRTKFINKDIKRLKLDLYHGLSHEIPVGINETGCKSIVTIHDLIHERYPEQYSTIDRNIYTRKYKYACKHADMIIAVSKQTKQDLIDLYKVAEKKIAVCYQSCDPQYARTVSEEEKQNIKHKYHLPDKYFISVGSVIERKNLLNTCKAMLINKKQHTLVVIGDGKKYKEIVKTFLHENGMENNVIFLSEKNDKWPYPAKADFPGLYQLATAMVYPSTFEGFGIPVLEALFSRVPVITSNVSCLPEAGGDAAYYVDPLRPEEIADGMIKLESDLQLVESMMEKGWRYAQNFKPEKCAMEVMDVYKKVMI